MAEEAGESVIDGVALRAVDEREGERVRVCVWMVVTLSSELDENVGCFVPSELTSPAWAVVLII